MASYTRLSVCLFVITSAAAPLAGQDTARVTGQPREAARRLEDVRITARSAPKTVSFLPERHGTWLLTGKKTENLLVDSMRANAAQNIARQVLGRIPGLVVVETEEGGFPSNGIAVRGLNPTQSIAMNVRQNGVGIAADPFGYPETYYLPPLEAVERVEIVRGASGLQFGPQLGGLVNYVMRRGDSSRPVAITLQETAGNDELRNTFASLAGGSGGVRWFGAVQRKSQGGWRPNSDFAQTTSYLSMSSALSETFHATVDYSGLRNRIHMPGGLTDAQFEAGARQSFRARNWLTTPWNVTSARVSWRPTRTLEVESVTSFLGSARSLVWRNEDGGPGASDAPDPVTQMHVNREVGREEFQNVTEELRIRAEHSVLGRASTLAAGVRWFGGKMHRQGGGVGTRASDFDLSIEPGTTYGYDLRFTTRNLALWAENAVRIGDRLSIAPGLRVEHLVSTAAGYKDTTFSPQSKSRTVPLFGVGVTWLSSGSTQVYANVTQAYRPLEYTAITPVGTVSRIDPSMHDTRGLTMDAGWRGTAADDRVRFDIGVFRLANTGLVGLRTRTESTGATYTERTNVGNSVHQGLESYVEVTPVALPDGSGTLTVFNAFALTDARYTSGDVGGNRVEYAPEIVNRTGITAARGPLSTTFLVSHTSQAFSDADNTIRSDDSIVGIVPGYTVLDWSATLVARAGWRVQGGVNNVTDRHYFTRRADEYPGPGILPSRGRSVYITLSVSP